MTTSPVDVYYTAGHDPIRASSSINEIEAPRPSDDCPTTQIVILQAYRRCESPRPTPVEAEEEEEEDEPLDPDRPDYECIARQVHLYKHLSNAESFSLYSVHNDPSEMVDTGDGNDEPYIELEAEYEVSPEERAHARSEQRQQQQHNQNRSPVQDDDEGPEPLPAPVHLQYRILAKVFGAPPMRPVEPVEPNRPPVSPPLPDNAGGFSEAVHVSSSAKPPPPRAPSAPLPLFTGIASIVDVVKAILVMDVCQSEHTTTKVVIVEDVLLPPSPMAAPPAAFGGLAAVPPSQPLLKKPVLVTLPLAQAFAFMSTLRIARASYVSRDDFDLTDLLSSKYLPTKSVDGAFEVQEKDDTVEEQAESSASASASGGDGAASGAGKSQDSGAAEAERVDPALEKALHAKMALHAKKLLRMKSRGVHFAAVHADMPVHDMADPAHAIPKPPMVVIAHHSLLGRKFANRKPIAGDGSDFYGEDFTQALHSRFAVHHSSVGPVQTKFPYVSKVSKQCWRAGVIAVPAEAELVHEADLHAPKPGPKKSPKGKSGDGDAADADKILRLMQGNSSDGSATPSTALVVVPDKDAVVAGATAGDKESVHADPAQQLAVDEKAAAAAAQGETPEVPPGPLRAGVDHATLQHVKRILPTVKPVAIATQPSRATGKLTVVLDPWPQPPPLTEDQQLDRLSWSRRFCPFFGPDKSFTEEGATAAYNVKLYSEYDRPALEHKIHKTMPSVQPKLTDGLFPHRPGVLERIILSHTDNVHAIESIVHGTLRDVGDTRLLPQDFAARLTVVRKKLEELDARFYREGHTRKNAMHGATFFEVQRQVLTHPYKAPLQEDVMLLALALQRRKDADATFDLQAASTMQRRDTGRRSFAKAMRTGSLMGTLRSKSFLGVASDPSQSVSLDTSKQVSRRSTIAGGGDGGIGGSAQLASFMLQSIESASSSPFGSMLSSRKPSFGGGPGGGGNSSNNPFAPTADLAPPALAFMNRDNSITPSARLALHKLELERMRDQFQTERFTRTVLSEADIGVPESQMVDDYQQTQLEMERYIQMEETQSKRRLLSTLEKKPLPNLTFSRVPKKPTAQ